MKNQQEVMVLHLLLVVRLLRMQAVVVVVWKTE
jgi:hypothetical protein